MYYTPYPRKRLDKVHWWHFIKTKARLITDVPNLEPLNEEQDPYQDDEMSYVMDV